jgi:hypothetical protein
MSFVIEEESGTYARTPERPRNGYWAGDFSQPGTGADLDRWFAWGRAQSVTSL